MKAKKAFLSQLTFSKPVTSLLTKPIIISRIAYKEVTKEKVYFVLVTQTIVKVLRPNKINFQIFYIIWNQDKKWMISIVQQAICLGYHLKKRKKARNILFEKGRKRDFSLVRLYWVIYLLNCIGKVIEKIVVNQVLQYCKTFFKLYPG